MKYLDLAEIKERVVRAYDPAAFREAAASVTSEIEAFLQRSQMGDSPVLNWREPLSNIADAEKMLGEIVSPGELAKISLARGQTIHNPLYIGHQVPAPVPVSAVFEMLSSISNQGMTVYEMGPWSSAVERVMINALGRKLGFSDGFGGIVTSGGSLANLTALLAARNKVVGDVWQKGVATTPQRQVIICHGESHYSVERAAGILGLGTSNCLKAALDDRQRIDVEQLEAQLRQLASDNVMVIAVVAAACSTRTGAYDRLRDISIVCKRHNVWFHVDAAHGGAAVFSKHYEHLLDGVAEADSVVWDAHKMLFMPALTTYLFYKKMSDQYHAVNQTATYLFDETASESETYNTGLGTIECTKRAAAFSLWGTWALYGEQLFTDLIDLTYGRAKQFAQILDAQPDFEMLHEPQANILVFRFIPKSIQFESEHAIGEFQIRVRKRLIESGQGYIVPAVDHGVSALRMVVMNPLTDTTHLHSIMASLREFASAMR